jgi:septum formation protein
MPEAAVRRLILASTSRWRRELLQRLHLPFDVLAPDVEESALPGEAPPALAVRLAAAKADAVAARHPAAVVIGSDQVADLDGDAIGKPGDPVRAAAQLQRMSGRLVRFHTAVAVVCRDSAFSRSASAVVSVRFRRLDEREIKRYLQLDQPWDCAGSARIEAAGPALLESVDSDDPTALIGLPLIRTCALLREAGIDPLQAGLHDDRHER